MLDSANVATDSVDARTLLRVLAQLRAGDFAARMPLNGSGLAAEVADGLNEVIIAYQELDDDLASVTELADRHRQVSQRATDEAAEDDVPRHIFAASASHELRTPTALILGFTEEILSSDALCEQDRGFLEVVHRNAQRLAERIEDLLAVGDAGIGGTNVGLAPTDFRSREMTELVVGGSRLALAVADGKIGPQRSEILVASDPGEPASKPHTLTVLVADDEPDLVLLMTRQLQRAGYGVITAANGAEALTMARMHRPDVAVFDVQMPVMSGIDALEMLRADPPIAAIPVVLMSAGLREDTVSKDLAAQARGFLRKPITQQELTAHIARAIDSSGRTQMAERSFLDDESKAQPSLASPCDDPADTAKGASDARPNHEREIRSRIIQMFGDEPDAEDRELFAGLVARFPARCDKLLHELDDAVKSADPRSVSQIAHALRGAVSNYGATNVASLLEAIEVDASGGALLRAPALLAQVRSELGFFAECLRMTTLTEDHPECVLGH